MDLWIEGPPWSRYLYPNHRYLMAKEKHPPQEGAILLKPSFGAAWRHRHHPIRIGIDTNRRGFLLTHRIYPKTQHRIDRYLEVTQTLVPIHEKIPTFTPQKVEIPTLPNDVILCVVGTASEKTVRWKSFHSLRQYIHRIVFAGGRNNQPFLDFLKEKGFRTLSSRLDLHQIGLIAQKSALLIGIDGGLTHLAIAARNAVQIPSQYNLVLYGSTDPKRTGPRNSTSLQRDPLPDCWPCYAKSCSIQTPCLDIQPQKITEFLSSCPPS
ncbi:MAG: glycosyltransferase family 9 protein [Myxococcota bacterium]|nr:glycosyltransferase family 9 protein [Myxococcota bacterium]